MSYSDQGETLEGVIQPRKEMTPEQMKEVVELYATALKQQGFVAIENRRAKGGSDQMNHVLWMCGRIPTILGVGSIEKAHRWLGFIQGVMWLEGFRTIEEMAEQNRVR